MKLSSNKTYILPSKVGLGLISIAFLVFIIAITFGHPFSYFITFFLISIIVVCAFITNDSISKLKTFRFHDQFIECKSEKVFFVDLSFKEILKVKRISSKVEGESVVKASIIDKANNRLKYSLSSEKCGIRKIPRLKIYTTYPLGLFKAWKYINSDKQVITYPQRINRENIYRHLGLGQGTNDQFKENLETNDEFLDHRKFRDTDSWKHIDWKAFARGRGLLTKQFSGQEGRVSILEVNKGDSLAYLGQVTSELFKCYDQSEVCVLLLGKDIISQGKDKSHLHNCLRILAKLGGECE